MRQVAAPNTPYRDVSPQTQAMAAETTCKQTAAVKMAAARGIAAGAKQTPSKQLRCDKSLRRCLSWPGAAGEKTALRLLRSDLLLSGHKREAWCAGTPPVLRLELWDDVSC